MTDARRRAKHLGATERRFVARFGEHEGQYWEGIGASDRTRTGDIQNHNLAL
jgi:hypothetical protein